jgi:hypothetical protein
MISVAQHRSQTGKNNLLCCTKCKIVTNNELNGMDYCSGMQRSRSCKLVLAPPSFPDHISQYPNLMNCIKKIRPRIKYPKRAVPLSIHMDMIDALLVIQQHEFKLWFNYVIKHQCIMVKGIHWGSISPWLRFLSGTTNMNKMTESINERYLVPP